MMRLLGSFVTHPGSLKAEASRNLLLIRGTTSERNNLLSVASTFDVAEGLQQKDNTGKCSKNRGCCKAVDLLSSLAMRLSDPYDGNQQL